jgi:hypothetical protein
MLVATLHAYPFSLLLSGNSMSFMKYIIEHSSFPLFLCNQPLLCKTFLRHPLSYTEQRRPQCVSDCSCGLCMACLLDASPQQAKDREDFCVHMRCNRNRTWDKGSSEICFSR